MLIAEVYLGVRSHLIFAGLPDGAAVFLDANVYVSLQP